jgi:hypothetical protein
MIEAAAMSGLLAYRDVAGERYRKAVLELHNAWIELAGIDRMMMNEHFLPPDPRSFGTNPDEFKLSLIHPVYVPHGSREIGVCGLVGGSNPPRPTRQSANCGDFLKTRE